MVNRLVTAELLRLDLLGYHSTDNKNWYSITLAYRDRPNHYTDTFLYSTDSKDREAWNRWRFG